MVIALWVVVVVVVLEVVVFVVVSVVTREGEVVVVCRTFLKGGKPLFL